MSELEWASEDVCGRRSLCWLWRLLIIPRASGAEPAGDSSGVPGPGALRFVDNISYAHSPPPRAILPQSDTGAVY